ncbi:MAG: 3-hydroxyacyl-[acyl-carrier-protein] dehydratase FabZ [Candidatus Puniceispirillum sp.]|nr:3-hydroxyacyl-[acyl-carrier-protein] dehydratase FabZ [Candidatus Pelagibacter sp.]MBA4282763.1 3-hydroxyacyl-[acyl-carrier-protein] dehydratase FabZ [Candidatus Puniceispirillum sp.]
MSTENTKLTVDIKELENLIPHRYPFLLVDRLVDIEPNVCATGIKNVTMNEWYFQGHFPGNPIMPGVLIVEALAQTAAALVIKSFNIAQAEKSDVEKAQGLPMVYFMTVDKTKFRKPVTPGDTLHLHVSKDHQHGNIWRFKGQARVNDVLVCESLFTAMYVEPKKG